MRTRPALACLFVVLAPASTAQVVEEWRASSGLLPTDDVPAWERYDAGTCGGGVATLGPSVLTIDTSSPCLDDTLSYSLSTYGPAQAFYWAEARVRVVQSAGTDPDAGVAYLAVAPANLCPWFITLDTDELTLHFGFEELGSVAVNTTSGMHTYRLEGDVSNGLSAVYVDGQLVLSGGVPSPGCSAPTTPRIVVFGNINTLEGGISEWEFVRGNTGIGSTVFCDDGQTVNSLGWVAGIDFSGSRSVAANDLVLESNHLPPSSFGYFLCSTAFSAPTPLVSSQGSLCLGGSIGRFNRPGEVSMASAAGEVSLAVDLTRVPQPTGTVAIAPGETWHFQLWYRDANPGPTSNVSRALQVVFE